MSIVVRYEVTGMSASKYDSIIAELDAAGFGHPAGRSHHVAFGDEGSVQVIDVFASPAALEAFGAKLMPILSKHGVSARPEVLGVVRKQIVGG